MNERIENGSFVEIHEENKIYGFPKRGEVERFAFTDSRGIDSYWIEFLVGSKYDPQVCVFSTDEFDVI